MKTLIIIPARYGSTRLPGKPLKLIAGQSMLSRVVDIARSAASSCSERGTDVEIDIVVATDDQRIARHCEEIGAGHVMTPASCPTGTDRALAALRALQSDADNVINLQGDAPLTPPDFITAMIDAFAAGDADVVTPVVQLDWSELDVLRQSKLTTPFSGTTVTLGASGDALWFSKAIIPAIRDEERLRAIGTLSPVHRHIGVYGYRRAMLELFVDLPQGRYEKLEGLEQLRVLEHGYRIGCVVVDYAGRPSMSGVDSAEDIVRAERLIMDQK
jgi:3-deoxy-manno-octulosonate cytidylyltransferase (CMP-KDO synthetase)